MKTLLINAHLDYQKNNSFSATLQEKFLDKYAARFSNDDLTILNLYATDIPRIEQDELLGIWKKQADNLPLTEAELALAKQSQALLEQFKEHHRIVIVSPLHNFNVTSRMKDYIDNILIARETFKYTENGSVGLMTDDYQVLLLLASGSIYTNQDRYTTLDFAPNYIRGIFQEIMGFDAFHLVIAQGTAVRSKEEVLAEADTALNKAFSEFYH
ncbi:NAD(P)H-dependent oxidoreductase [Streptococcus gallolyticus]|uniref:FMN-dependent NADH-azoreductase n=1 Tax=Streptococcus gallolyticus TaxID=315405 RepID=UPI001F3DB895|nr:NAD(P)H-dependent oxidoreductase [Streptococcus gallolyticus]MCF1633405.1 NAD(P)H-dependent oxidoreductase [Streptococcus gallolyticus]